MKMANFGKHTRQGFRSLLVNDILVARADCAHPERIKESYVKLYRRGDADKFISSTGHLGAFDIKKAAASTDARISERLDELGQRPMNRKDVKYVASLILTRPSQVPPADEAKFFKGFEEFCIRYFGVENMLCYAVHNHETTPHAQVYGVPVVNGRMDSAKWHNRRRYQELHGKLQDFMDKCMGYHVEVTLDAENPRKKANTVSVNTLKDRTSKAELKQQKEANKALDAERRYWLRRTQKAEKVVRCLERIGLLDKVKRHVSAEDELTEAELNTQYEMYHGQRVDAGRANKANQRKLNCKM